MRATSIKSKSVITILCAIILTLMFSVTANADTGPKPSIVIKLENMDDTICYGTLLSETISTGPFSAAEDGVEYTESYYFSEDIWQIFVDYKDTDGYYFLQWGERCDETNVLSWTYYPPQSFKLLLYYPETGAFLVSDIYERYAFDSYFTVDMSGADTATTTDNPVLKLDKSYDYTTELIALICRILITIAIEMAIAICFGFRGKKAILTLLTVNIVTQIALNVWLNLTVFQNGRGELILTYVLSELLVCAVEAGIYAVLLRKSDEPRITWRKLVIYAITANAASFAAGLLIVKLIPGIF